MSTFEELVKPHNSNFVCTFCRKSFVIESRYLAHECESMRRERECKTPRGQQALKYYQEWMRYQRRMVPSLSTFKTSKLYNAFMSFAEFVQRVRLPRVDVFMKLMVNKQFQPTMWCSDDVYTLYLNHLDVGIAPLEQAKFSVNYLLRLADRLEVDVSDIFDHMPVEVLLSCIRSRHLSPWLLIFSSKFNAYLASLVGDHKRMVEGLIKPKTWAEKIDKHPDQVEDIYRLIEAMGI
jgi:hypothetical protein